MITALTASGYTVACEGNTLDEAVLDLEARGYTVIDFADDETIIIAGEEGDPDVYGEPDNVWSE